ncbi:MAG TPA: InlB B-repeat-containing protein, partial [Anaerolineales bacterium]|nr:InlB B-repeat-containing protein [Anaerolineales bacterium]
MKIQRVFTAVFLAFALLLANVAVARAMPPLPSSFYGTVKLDGANVPTGTVVSARINGVIYAWGTALIYEGDTVYTFDVPGEDTDEPGIQGGVPGDTVVFYIGDYIADQTAPWQGGTLEELNLTASTNRTVVFDANGGTGTMSPQVANAPTALTLNAFARSGYTFSGWNTAANGSGTSYADGATYPFAADATLYAQWTANSYTVTFNANGGTAPSPATKPVTFGSAYGALA